MKNLRHYFMPAAYESAVSVSDIIEEVLDMNSPSVESPVFSLVKSCNTSCLVIKESADVVDNGSLTGSTPVVERGVRAIFQIQNLGNERLFIRRLPSIIRDEDGRIMGLSKYAMAEGKSPSYVSANNDTFITMLGDFLRKFASDHPSIQESFGYEIPESDKNVVAHLKVRPLV